MSSETERVTTASPSRRERVEVAFNTCQLLVSWMAVVAFLSAAAWTKLPPDPRHPRPHIARGPHRLLLVDGHVIPPTTLSDFGSYPNPLAIEETERRLFHPVVQFPKVWMELKDQGETSGSGSSDKYNNTNHSQTHSTIPRGQSFGIDGLQPRVKRTRVPNYTVLDLTTSRATDMLASEDERQERRRGTWSGSATPTATSTKDTQHDYMVGRYDENRVNLYESALFDDTANSIDSFQGVRTLHIGIDLDGPVGTKVFAFADGVVHSAGYNAELGDYGNVVVVEHALEHGSVYALYGHLDDKSIQNKRKGTPVKRGRMIGRMGDIHENGGWRTPHVHFQLSIHPPETHDMPGVVSMYDRPRALVHYPDPRYVLGPLY